MDGTFTISEPVTDYKGSSEVVIGLVRGTNNAEMKMSANEIRNLAKNLLIAARELDGR